MDSGANAVVDTANTVAGEITNGAGLVGDALTNAYQQAADKARCRKLQGAACFSSNV